MVHSHAVKGGKVRVVDGHALCTCIFVDHCHLKKIHDAR